MVLSGGSIGGATGMAQSLQDFPLMYLSCILTSLKDFVLTTNKTPEKDIFFYFLLFLHQRLSSGYLVEWHW